MPSTTFHRDRLTWLAYLMLAFYAYCINILGPITPFLKSEFGLTYTLSSLHFTAFAIGMLVVGAGGHLVIQRIGRWPALWLGAAGLSCGALLLVLGKTPAVTISAAFLMGLMGSLILAIVPATLADLHGEQRPVAISEANMLASLVSAAAPLLVGWFASRLVGWRLALGAAALVPVLLYLAYGKARVSSTGGPKDSRVLLRGRLPGLFWVYWLALMLAVAVEFCMIFWCADFLETVIRIPKASAAQAVSLFLGGMILGRLAGSRLVQRYSPTRVVIGSILLAAAGFLLFWQAGTAFFGLSGLFLTGLGVASFYPLILSMTIGAAQGNIIQATSRTTLASGSAILLLPLILGRLADVIGISAAYGMVLLLLGMVFVIVQAAGRISQT